MTSASTAVLKSEIFAAVRLGTSEAASARNDGAPAAPLGTAYRLQRTTGGANGNFIVAWQGESAGDTSGVAAQRFVEI